MVEPDMPQMVVRGTRLARWISKVTNTHTLRICNNYCFYTTTMATRRLLSVTSHVHCLSSLFCLNCGHFI